MLRSQRDCADFFTIFSKYTPCHVSTPNRTRVRSKLEGRPQGCKPVARWSGREIDREHRDLNDSLERGLNAPRTPTSSRPSVPQPARPQHCPQPVPPSPALTHNLSDASLEIKWLGCCLCACVRGGVPGGHLNQRHPHEQQPKRDPLVKRQLLPQQDDREHRRRENLQLVCAHKPLSEHAWLSKAAVGTAACTYR